MGLGNLPTMMPMERTGQRRRKKLRRMRCRHQKIRKGTSGYALRAFPANLKSGQFICSKSGQFYLLTTEKNAYLCKILCMTNAISTWRQKNKRALNIESPAVNGK